MHRPGICSVHRDVVTLDGVTIEEVEQHHLKTLTLCVARVNEETDQADSGLPRLTASISASSITKHLSTRRLSALILTDRGDLLSEVHTCDA